MHLSISVLQDYFGVFKTLETDVSNFAMPRPTHGFS